MINSSSSLCCSAPFFILCGILIIVILIIAPLTLKSAKDTITIINPNTLQNTQHVVLRNRPILYIGTERLACLNNSRSMQLGTLQWRSRGGGGRGQPPPGRNSAPLLPPNEHFVQRSMESRHFESQSAPLLTPEPLLPPSHFEKSGYAPGNLS